MNRDELRAVQEPLKARYREDPASALHPVSASAVFGVPVAVEVRTAAGAVRAGLHPAAGGDGSDACSGDMLMEALVACAGVTLHAVSVAFGVDLREVEVRAEATFDARGTLGVDRTAPVGILGPRVVAEVTTDADDTTLQRLATATERYCVVGQSLREPPSIEVRRREPRDR
ncbi:OsmC family protein [Terrabacter sp. Ter38]|uniref:OsmC family protein n=1 Tax=Terrabacter sp. Ter38 TaxID=2926030 RepID=UPI0021176B34|nr:OsmC family protein [Terrabacter sp. Ter38]